MYKVNGFYYISDEEMRYIQRTEEARRKIPAWKWKSIRPVRWYTKTYKVMTRRGIEKYEKIFKN